MKYKIWELRFHFTEMRINTSNVRLVKNSFGRFGRLKVFAPFLIIIFIKSPKQSLGDLLFLLCFLLLFLLSLPNKVSLRDLLFLLHFLLLFLFLLLLLHHPDCCQVMYCYSTFLFHYYYYSYYSSSTHFCPLNFSEMPWSNFMKPCRNIICHVKLCF